MEKSRFLKGMSVGNADLPNDNSKSRYTKNGVLGNVSKTASDDYIKSFDGQRLVDKGILQFARAIGDSDYVDAAAQRLGYVNAAEAQKYKNDNPNLYNLLDGMKYRESMNLSSDLKEAVLKAKEEDEVLKFKKIGGADLRKYRGISEYKTPIQKAVEKVDTGEEMSLSDKLTVSENAESLYRNADTYNTYEMISNNSPKNIELKELAEKAMQKQKNGEELTEDDKKSINRYENLREISRSMVGDMYKMTDDIKLNKEKSDIVTGGALYEKAAYGDNIEKTKARMNLYINTGISNYLEGVENSWQVIVGGLDDENSKKIAQKPQNGYNLASYALSRYFSENGLNGQKFVQDVATSLAQNTIPIMFSAATSAVGGGLGLTPKSVDILSKAAQISAFSLSVFGNSYKEGLQLSHNATGKYNEWRSLAYALSNVAAETLTEAVSFYNPITKSAGDISERVIKELSKSISSNVLLWGGITFVHGMSEFTEEFAQSLISPILQKEILGLDVSTLFSTSSKAKTATDIKKEISEVFKGAVYDGAVGFATGFAMSSISDIFTVKTVAEQKRYGAYYKKIFNERNVNLNDVATYLARFAPDTKSASYEYATAVFNGDHSDYTVGQMMISGIKNVENAKRFVFTEIGKNAMAESPEIFNVVLESYKVYAQNDYYFPQEVEDAYNILSDNKYSDTDAQHYYLGKLMVALKAYMPRAEMMNRMYNDVFNQNKNTSKYSAYEDSGHNSGNYAAEYRNHKQTQDFSDIVDAVYEDDASKLAVYDAKSNSDTYYGSLKNEFDEYRTDGDVVKTNSDGVMSGSEILKSFANTELYDELQDTVIEYANSQKAVNSSFKNRYDELYYNKLRQYQNDNVESHDLIPTLAKQAATSELIDDYVNNDPDFAKKLYSEHRELFNRIFGSDNEYMQNYDYDGGYDDISLFSGRKPDFSYKTDLKGQQNILSVCEDLGIKAVFEDLRGFKGYNNLSPDGYIDKDGLMHINIYAKNSLDFVIKHELTHYAEKASLRYDGFSTEVQKTEVYKKWLTEKTGEKNFKKAFEIYKNKVMNSDSTVVSPDSPKIMREIISDFVGDMLFKDCGNGITATAEKMQAKPRCKFLQIIIRFISFIKSKLKGKKFISRQLAALEYSFKDMLIDASMQRVKEEKKTVKVGTFVSDYDDMSYCFVRCLDEDIIEKANKLYDEGKNISEISMELGVIRDPKNNWLCQLDFSKYRIFVNGNARMDGHRPNPNLVEKDGKLYGVLSDFVFWKELYERFPDMAKMQFRAQYMKGSYYMGAFFEMYDEVFVVDRNLLDAKREKGDNTIKWVLAEQIQFIIQIKEKRNIDTLPTLIGALHDSGNMPYAESLGKVPNVSEKMSLNYNAAEARLTRKRHMLRDIYLGHYGETEESIKMMFQYQPNFPVNDIYTIEKWKIFTLKDLDKRNNNSYYDVIEKFLNTKEDYMNDDFYTDEEKESFRLQEKYGNIVEEPVIEKPITVDDIGVEEVESGKNSKLMKNFILYKAKDGKKHNIDDENISVGNEGFLSYCNDPNTYHRTVNYRFNRKLLELPLAATDTVKRKLSPETIEKLKGTGLKNLKGEPLSMFYTAMPRYGDKFKVSSLGLILRTLKGSVEEFKRIIEPQESRYNRKISEVYASVKNPLYVIGDVHEGTVYDVIGFLMAKEEISFEKAREILDTKRARPDLKYKHYLSGVLRNVIKGLGYDSIIFVDETFDKNSLGVVVFDREQIVNVSRDGTVIKDSGIIPQNDIENIDADPIAHTIEEKGQTAQKVKLYLSDLLESNHKEIRRADRHIQAGSSDFFDKNFTSIEQAKSELNKFFKARAKIEPTGLDTKNNSIYGMDRLDYEKNVLKDINGNMLSLFNWSSKRFSLNVEQLIKKRGLPLKSLHNCVDDFFIKREKSPTNCYGIFTEFDVNLVNPIMLESKTGSWNTEEIGNQLIKYGKIQQIPHGELLEERPDFYNKYDHLVAKLIRERVKCLGYDGILLLSMRNGYVVPTLFPLYDNQVTVIAENGLAVEPGPPKEIRYDEPPQKWIEIIRESKKPLKWVYDYLDRKEAERKAEEEEEENEAEESEITEETTEDIEDSYGTEIQENTENTEDENVEETESTDEVEKTEENGEDEEAENNEETENKEEQSIIPNEEEEYNFKEVIINPSKTTVIRKPEILKEVLHGLTDNTEILKTLTVGLMNHTVRQLKNSSEVVAGNTGWFEKSVENYYDIKNKFKVYVYGDLLKKPLNGFDTVGRKVSSDILTRFSDTVCKNEKGELLSFYMLKGYTTQQKFYRYSSEQFGYHLSTIDAARDSFVNNKSLPPSNLTKIFEECYVNLKNPYFLQEDFENWTPLDLARQLCEKGVMRKFEYVELSRLRTSDRIIQTGSARKRIMKCLYENGYDGIVYINKYRDPQSFAVIVFDPTKFEIVARHSVADNGDYINLIDKKPDALSRFPEYVRKSRNYNFNNKNSNYLDDEEAVIEVPDEIEEAKIPDDAEYIDQTEADRNVFGDTATYIRNGEVLYVDKDNDEWYNRDYSDFYTNDLWDEDDPYVTVDNVENDKNREKRLKANAKFKMGEFGYYYKADELGRIVRVHADRLYRIVLSEAQKQEFNNSYIRPNNINDIMDEENRAQSDESTDENTAYIIDEIFGGPKNPDNEVIMEKSLEYGEYREMQIEWNKAISKGHIVNNVNIKINYEGDSLKPKSFDISYKINNVSRFKHFDNLKKMRKWKDTVRDIKNQMDD